MSRSRPKDRRQNFSSDDLFPFVESIGATIERRNFLALPVFHEPNDPLFSTANPIAQKTLLDATPTVSTTAQRPAKKSREIFCARTSSSHRRWHPVFVRDHRSRSGSPPSALSPVKRSTASSTKISASLPRLVLPTPRQWLYSWDESWS
jgi:hypothetical protein